MDDQQAGFGDAGPIGHILTDCEPGSDFVPELAPIARETVIVKAGKGTFYASDLEPALRAGGVPPCSWAT